MRNKLTLILILLLAFGLRLISINQSLWLDEATSVLVARDMSWGEIITKFSPGDFHPPLYYVLLTVWIKLFGSTEVAARTLSVLFGVGTVYFLFKIASKLYDRVVGLAASIFLTFSPLHIYYSQEARMYAAAAFFALASVWFFINLISSEKQKFFDKALFVTFVLLLFYTNYIASFLAAFFVIYLLLEKKSFLRNIKSWIGILFVLTIFCLPLIPLVLQQLNNAALAHENTPAWWSLLGRTNIKEVLLVPVKFMLGRISIENKEVYAGVVLLSSIIFATPLFYALRNLRNSRFVWLWLMVPLIIALLQGLFFSGFSYFRLVFLLPAFYMLITVGLFSIGNLKFRMYLALGVLLINGTATCIYLFFPQFHREDWRSAISYIENNSDVNTVSIFVTNNQRDAYNYYSEAVPSFGPQRLEKPLPGKIWLFRYVQPIFDPQDNVRGSIESMGYIKQNEHDFNGVTVWEYDSPGK